MEEIMSTEWKKWQLLAILVMLTAWAEAQVSVNGKVVDEKEGRPLEHAVVEIRSQTSKDLLSTVNTGASGVFSTHVSESDIMVRISFIGHTTKNINGKAGADGQIDLGTVLLSKADITLEEVVVRAEKSSTEFKLDKRVFNVGQDLSSTGMSALEVLNNVPSVMVNIDGQISLRGSSGVQILINGKPSVLADESSNALGTITADMIESIEVITNPSAKYQAEGTAGILNIILKKEQSKDFNGSISLNTGIPDNHSVGVSMSRRANKFNLFTQLGLGRRSLPRHDQTYRRNLIAGTELYSSGTNYRNEKFYNITLGTDYHINALNVLTLSGSFAYEIEDQPATTQYRSYEADALVSEWKRKETTEATNPKWQYELNYEKQFSDDKKHNLIASAIGSFFGKDQSSVFTNLAGTGAIDETDQQAVTDFKEANYTFKLDYTQPFGDQVTLETGAQYLISEVGNDYTVKDLQEDQWVVNENLTNDFRFDQNVLGVYATGSYELNQWGVKAGLRVENTDLSTLLINTGVDNQRNYTDFFPTLHTSYKFSNAASLQLGYSRRIYRPRLWELNPYLNMRDNYNIRTGNPELDPEYSDAYELTGIFKVPKTSFSASLFHRFTRDVIEDVSTFEDNITTNRPYNIGTRASTGLELNGKYDPLKWLSFNGDFNYSYFNRKGQFESRVFDFDGNRWSARLVAKLDLPAEFDLEIGGHYRSAYETVNDYNKDYSYMDLGLRKKLWKGRLVASLAVNDVFGSRISESEIDREDFYQYRRGFRGRFMSLGLSFGFGKGEAMTYSGGRRR
ncbi:outer membrane beta-barrel family protein [Niabella terrae]